MAPGDGIEGTSDDVEESRDPGDRSGGESVVSRAFCATLAGVRVLALEITGLMVSARVLDRRKRDSPSGFDSRCEFDLLLSLA